MPSPQAPRTVTTFPHETLSNQRHRPLWQAAFITAACICTAAAVPFAARCLAPAANQTPLQLPQKLNPNTAPVASLIRLPGIGINRAEAIHAYRRRARNDDTAKLPFEKPEDLQNVPGIGPRTVERISPWLVFDQAQARGAPNAAD